MRGRSEGSRGMFSYVDPDSRIPSDHPLRRIKAAADAALARLSAELDKLYPAAGRRSIPPERLLKGLLLMALFSVRSERRFCEELEWNLLWRWFLDMDVEDPAWDHSTFSRNRDRLLNCRVCRQFFDEVVAMAREAELLSDEHFSVDGTLIDAWASQKSFRPVAEAAERGDGDPPAGRERDFRGEKRSNATHRSTTDPDARLLRKSDGEKARLAYVASALMDNRHGLVSDWVLDVGENNPEHRAVEVFLTRNVQCRGLPMKTLGGDSWYHSKSMVATVRKRGVKPHFARHSTRRTPGLDERTWRSKAYSISQRVRKRIEEIFGWLKSIGGLRRTRYRGRRRVEAHSLMAASAWNLLRMAKLTAPA